MGKTDLHRARSWLTERFTARRSSSHRRNLAASCVLVFLLSLTVRLLYWQDLSAEIARGDSTVQALAAPYRREAGRMLERGGILFPRDQIDRGDGRLIVHPPGYSILMAASHLVFGETDTPLRLAQVLLSAVQAVVVVLIAAEVLPLAIGIIAGMLIALSPHLAYYSIFLSPDSLAVLPILIAVYLILRSTRRPRLLTVIGAGISVGLSCWLRSNGLYLPVFLSFAVLLSFGKQLRLRYALVLCGVALLVIAPITIRNCIVYGRFIPISIGAGLNLIEGIAEYDKGGRFDLPVLDPDVIRREVEWNGRADFGESLYYPDGIDRDRDRFSRGLAVIRSNPSWFAGVVLRRMLFMIRYNDFRFENPTSNAPTAPAVSARPTFGHNLVVPLDASPVWSTPMADAVGDGTFIASEAAVALDPNREWLEITADSSEFGDQFISGPIAVDDGTDYILALRINRVRGSLSAKVLTPDSRIILAASRITKAAMSNEVVDERDPNSTAWKRLEFAAGRIREVRIGISNYKMTEADRAEPNRSFVQLDEARLFRLGPTPYNWTRYMRSPIRAIQKNLYKTEWMWALVSLGLVLTGFAGRNRTLVILLVVPVYYLIVHSPLHTEYRYIIAIQCFLAVVAATTIYTAAMVAREGIARWIPTLAGAQKS